MIERKFVAQNMKEFAIKKFIASKLNRVGLSDIKLKRTPLGDKIVISTLKPGLVVGRAGSTITMLTSELKKNFKLNNPQIELDEIKDPYGNAPIVAEQIVNSLERFGTKRFKGIGHKVISEVMKAGALGVEILISGKIPSSRAKTWRFYQGYLKKCGDISVEGVLKTITFAKLKAGVVGVQVSILPGDVHLPDKIKVLEEKVEVVEEVKPEELSEAQKELIKNIETAGDDGKTKSKEIKKKGIKKKTKDNSINHSTKLNKASAKKTTKKTTKKKIETKPKK
jgi:small subunit ribosomal protein S3